MNFGTPAFYHVFDEDDFDFDDNAIYQLLLPQLMKLFVSSGQEKRGKHHRYELANDKYTFFGGTFVVMSQLHLFQLLMVTIDNCNHDIDTFH